MTPSEEVKSRIEATLKAMQSQGIVVRYVMKENQFDKDKVEIDVVVRSEAKEINISTEHV